MDFTRSPFGRRMLRRWVSRPLVSYRELEERMAAVHFLKGVLENGEAGNSDSDGGSHSSRTIAGIHNKLGQLVDLERGLCRIHYRQAGPNELLRILRSLNNAVNLMPRDMEIAEPRLLADILSQDVWSNGLRDSIKVWIGQIDSASARSGQKDMLFASGPLHDLMHEHHARIAAVNAEIQQSSASIAKRLGVSGFEFKTISGIDYLIDIKNTKARLVPSDWIKISGTKTNSRFHTPFIAEKLAERERLKEALQNAAKDAYAIFLAEISSKYQELRQLVSSLATLDSLFSLAVLAGRKGYCKPEMSSESAEAQIELVDACHPVLSTITAQYVPNSVCLGGGDDNARAMILTGPNAGGKSSLIRTVALISIMAQCGSYVPAGQAKLTIIDAIFTRIGASDNMLAGESTFMVEMRETAELMRQATPRSLAILDELGRGTSTHDGAAIAYAVLDYLVNARPLTLFVTHYAHLIDEFSSNALIKEYHMSFLEKAGTGDTDPSASVIKEITFLFKLVEGASKDSFGLNVARMAGLPTSLLMRAKERGDWMRTELESRWADAYASSLKQAIAKASAHSA
ncbi:Mismatch repair protein msh3 [Dipsacomyces acuminosporus]|nr:Mismatch repair protein msh3 [Dipsacomyces acuminosporus]